MRHFGEWIARRRVMVLVIAIILAIPAGYSAVNTALNYDILSYLPVEAESVKGQKIMDESFGSTDSGILVFKNIQEYRIKQMEEQIENLEGVSSVVWARDLVDVSVPVEVLPEDIRETFYRENENAVMLMVNFKNSAADDLTQNAIVDIRKIIDKDKDEGEGFLAGASAVIRDVIDLSNVEKNLYIALAIVFATVILAVTLPSTIIPILFLLGIGFGVIYNLGTNFFLPDVSYVTSAIAGVLQLGVTMDFSIFLYHRYEEERVNCSDKAIAMGIAIKKTAVSISGAALTTMAGFLALVAMELTLGANIGIVMAKGVLIGVICTLTVMPSLLLVFEKPIHRFNHGTILPSFEKISKFTVKRHIPLMILSLVLLIPAIYGSINKEVYYKLDKSLPRDMESIVAIEEMKETFDMKSTYFLAVDRNIEETEIKKMVKEIERVEGINNVIAYQKYIGQMIPKEMLPEELLSSFLSDDFTKILINSKYSAATEEGNIQTEAINSLIKKYDKNALLTGEIPMSKDLIDTTDHDIEVVNIISIVLLVIIIGITFKSITLPIILIMSIELAVYINMSIPYYTGVTIPFIASIVIGSIQLGTTVDYAILLTNRYKEELFECSTKFEAMQIAIKSCAKSIVTSGLTFFGSTFAVAVVSNIDIISSLSLMMGRGALISMIVILFLLPALLLMFERLISVTTIGWKRSETIKGLELSCDNGK